MSLSLTSITLVAPPFVLITVPVDPSLVRWVTYTAAPGRIDFTIGGPVHYTAEQSLMDFTATYGMADYTAADSRLDYTALEND